MEFGFALPGVEELGVYIYDQKTLDHVSQGDVDKLHKAVDTFGRCSAAAQGLRRPVTCAAQLLKDQKVYMMCDKSGKNASRVLGGLKIGRKKLMMRKENGSYENVSPMCLLDFYIHEHCQRQGFGRMLFENFLRAENLQPNNVAYDRPSPKLRAFLQKHYGLSKHVPQTNNFVMFQDSNEDICVPVIKTGRKQIKQSTPPCASNGRKGGDPRHARSPSPSPMVPRTPSHGSADRRIGQRTPSPSLKAKPVSPPLPSGDNWPSTALKKPADRLIYAKENPIPLRVKQRSSRGIVDQSPGVVLGANPAHQGQMRQICLGVHGPGEAGENPRVSTKCTNTCRKVGREDSERQLCRDTILGMPHAPKAVFLDATVAQLPHKPLNTSLLPASPLTKHAGKVVTSDWEVKAEDANPPSRPAHKYKPPWAMDSSDGIDPPHFNIRSTINEPRISGAYGSMPLRSAKQGGGVGDCLNWE